MVVASQAALVRVSSLAPPVLIARGWPLRGGPTHPKNIRSSIKTKLIEHTKPNKSKKNKRQTVLAYKNSKKLLKLLHL